jgi:hypothetical protein
MDTQFTGICVKSGKLAIGNPPSEVESGVHCKRGMALGKNKTVALRGIRVVYA